MNLLTITANSFITAKLLPNSKIDYKKFIALKKQAKQYTPTSQKKFKQQLKSGYPSWFDKLNMTWGPVLGFMVR